ncbi:methyltransferase domain-containing protein [Catellatospora sp. NPDC049609]|uniref:class I SAM-dependent methyltransferase n=1 Tax=Catellatospora sp. NPDC049609 TaxID=3155505 RepID=UPI00342A69A7
MTDAHAAHHAAHDEHDIDDFFTERFWDERYGSKERIWSGNPNPHVVTTAADLVPGTALDVGCGEGADAVWLAARGWQVTGVDVSGVALGRAAAHAAEAGEQTAARATWLRADILTWDPAPARFDLVSAQFMQLPDPARTDLHRRLAAAVRPGGTLLIVGHHFSDLETTIGRPHLPALMFTAEQAAAALDPADWEIHTATPGREATDAEGRPVTVHDAVLRAVRLR